MACPHYPDHQPVLQACCIDCAPKPKVEETYVQNASPLLIERVAMAIYSHDGGLDEGSFREVHGKGRDPWADIPEHERDDFRYMACAALETVYMGIECHQCGHDPRTTPPKKYDSDFGRATVQRWYDRISTESHSRYGWRPVFIAEAGYELARMFDHARQSGRADAREELQEEYKAFQKERADALTHRSEGSKTRSGQP